MNKNAYWRKPSDVAAMSTTGHCDNATRAYYQHGERLYYEGTAGRLVVLKKQEETMWLNEVSSVALQQALRHLDQAFRNFFEGRAHRKQGVSLL